MCTIDIFMLGYRHVFHHLTSPLGLNFKLNSINFLLRRISEMADLDSISAKAGDAELQDFLMVERQKAQVNAQVCVPKCVRRTHAFM